MRKDWPSHFHLHVGASFRPTWVAYGCAIALCALATVLALPFAETFDSSSIVLVFMLAVVLSASWFGRGPALVSAVLSVVLFNAVFVPPRYSFAVADERFLVTLAAMLLVGLIVGQLTAVQRAQAIEALARERRVRSLYDISRELGTALTVEHVAEISAAFLHSQLGVGAVLWVKQTGADLVSFGPTTPELERAARRVAGVAVDDQPGSQEAGVHTPTPGLIVPLSGTMAVRGAMAVLGRPASDWSEDERRLLDTCATLIGSAMERVHYIDVAQQSALQIEGERLRNSLLSAVSHDLRTPLAALVGLAESLHLTRPAPSAQQADIVDAMAASLRRMSSLVTNLLDMARMESGTVRLNMQWQPLEEVIGSGIAAAGSVLAGHHLKVAVPPDAPLVHMDALLMERVLVNVLENAAKYTPAGTTVHINAAVRPDWVDVTVRDDGPGWPSDRPDELFLKFERGVRESATPGVGLGLALCRVIVEAHGGRIRAERPIGGGACLVMTFPRGAPPEVMGASDAPGGLA